MKYRGFIMEDLKDIRSEIDSIDDTLAQTLQRRFEIVDRVAKVKREKGLPIFDAKREGEIIDRVCAMVGSGCEKEVREVFSVLFAASRARQLEKA